MLGQDRCHWKYWFYENYEFEHATLYYYYTVGKYAISMQAYRIGKTLWGQQWLVTFSSAYSHTSALFFQEKIMLH